MRNSSSQINRTVELEGHTSSAQKQGQRSREYLAEPDVEHLEAAKKTRNGNPDATMINLAYRHRCADEVATLRRDQVDIDHPDCMSADGSGARRRCIPSKETHDQRLLPGNMPVQQDVPKPTSLGVEGAAALVVHLVVEHSQIFVLRVLVGVL